MAIHQYTMADIEVIKDWFSDAYKDVNGFRPGEGWTDEMILNWVNTTDIQAKIDEQEAEQLAMVQRLGFNTVSEYYDDLDRKYYEQCTGQKATAEPKKQDPLKDPHSPQRVINDWEEGRM